MPFFSPNLDPVNTLEWPFSMILYRLIAKFLSFFFSRKHTMVTAVADAVPLFPLYVKWLLQIPGAISGISVRGKVTVLKANVSHTSSGFTSLDTRPSITIKF